jgi:predicted enzyme related to lactoylglutathione lyase
MTSRQLEEASDNGQGDRHRRLLLPGAKTVWRQQEGPTVFTPFAQDTDYFGRAKQQWLINFRVDDLDAMMADLKAAGIAVETRAEWDSEAGRFCRIHDPEGNPIELWEPSAGNR